MTFRMMPLVKAILVFWFLVLAIAIACRAQTPKPCAKGEYRSVDGRCLRDRTGETRPAGDGCNTATCMDKACRWSNQTAMGCVHGDDPMTDGTVITSKDPPISTNMSVTADFVNWTAVWIDEKGMPVAVCGEDKDHKLTGCKLSEGHTLTELLQLVTDAQNIQSKENQERYDYIYGICKSGLEDALAHTRRIEKALKGK